MMKSIKGARAMKFSSTDQILEVECTDGSKWTCTVDSAGQLGSWKREPTPEEIQDSFDGFLEGLVEQLESFRELQRKGMVTGGKEAYVEEKIKLLERILEM